MNPQEQLKQDLGFITEAVQRSDPASGIPALYFLWAVLVLAGFSLPDLAPRWAGAYWFVAGPLGGLVSWFVGVRQSRRNGVCNAAQGRRYGLHWLVSGLAFIGVALPVVGGQAPIATVVPYYLLVAGLAYALAGVHLDRPMLWCGLAMLGGYAVLVLSRLPYVWSATGVVVAAGLLAAGVATRRQETRGQHA